MFELRNSSHSNVLQKAAKQNGILGTNYGIRGASFGVQGKLCGFKGGRPPKVLLTGDQNKADELPASDIYGFSQRKYDEISAHLSSDVGSDRFEGIFPLHMTGGSRKANLFKKL